MNKNNLPDNQITIYQAPDGKVNIEVICANGHWQEPTILVPLSTDPPK